MSVRSNTTTNVYLPTMFVRPVVVGMQDMGGDISEVLRESTTGDIEGKCIVQGFVRPGSVKIQSYSAGILEANHIVYQVTVECDVCSPVEDEIIECMAKNITKAGVRAEVDTDPTPMMIFLARDHHHTSTSFSNIKAGDRIRVKVIGQRFELNDPYVSVIASLVEEKEKRKPRIEIGEQLS